MERGRLGECILANAVLANFIIHAQKFETSARAAAQDTTTVPRLAPGRVLLVLRTAYPIFVQKAHNRKNKLTSRYDTMPKAL